MEQFKYLTSKIEILLPLFQIKVKHHFLIFHGDHKIKTLKLEIFLQLLMQMDKYKIGT